MALERWTPLVTRVLAPNAGPMTLDGTNTLVISGGGRTVVVDPGPADAAHLDRLRAQGPVDLVLLTHRHIDHVESAAEFAASVSAPVRAFDAALCMGADPLLGGERIEAGGTVVEVVHAPGHTDDSVALYLPEHPAMLTGDTILGRGTTIIAHPDGSVADFLATLDRLEAYGSIPALPAHGPMLPDLAAVCGAYRAHRRQRLDEIRGVLARLGMPASDDEATVTAVVDEVYAHIDPAVRFAAEASTRAQLAYLAAA